jgi:YHS domain-containing protein
VQVNFKRSNMTERKEMDVIRSISRPGLFAAASLIAGASLAFAHDPAKKAGMGGMMKECGEHHAAAMKASDDVSMHLAEAKRSSTLAEMRTHVEAADKAMTEMKNQMSMCMEMMETKQGKASAGMMGSGTTSAEKKSAAKVVDPVCGMEVEMANAPTTTYKGKTYYFCSEDDKAKFLKNPEQYANKNP